MGDVSGTVYQALKDGLTWIGRRFRGPRLTIGYDPRKTMDKARAANANMRVACFYHLLVKNRGKATASRCVGYLESVESTTGTPQGLRKPELLKWANEPAFDPIDIEPDQERRLDLVYVFQDEPNLHFFFAPPALPVGIRQIFPPGSYRVTIRVKAENARAVLAAAVVVTDGIWDAVDIRLD